MIHKNEEIDKKERAIAHQKLLAELGETKTNVLRGKDMGLNLKTLNIADEVAKFKGIKPLGYTVLVRLYTEAQEKQGALMDTDRDHAEQVYHAFMGLVIGIGSDAYDPSSVDKDGNKRFPNGPWCKVGDIISFPKTAGYYYYYNHPDGTTSPLYVIKEHAPDLEVDVLDVEAVKRK